MIIKRNGRWGWGVHPQAWYCRLFAQKMRVLGSLFSPLVPCGHIQGNTVQGSLWVCPNVQRRFTLPGMARLSLYLPPAPPWSLTSKEQGARTGLGLWERKVLMEEVKHPGLGPNPRGAGV